MSHYTLERQGVSAWESIHIALLAFPIACFTLTVLTDLAYWATENLLWLHFSEWLLLAGLVASGIELLIRLIEWIARKRRPTWLAVIGASWSCCWPSGTALFTPSMAGRRSCPPD